MKTSKNKKNEKMSIDEYFYFVLSKMTAEEKAFFGDKKLTAMIYADYDRYIRNK